MVWCGVTRPKTVNDYALILDFLKLSQEPVEDVTSVSEGMPPLRGALRLETPWLCKTLFENAVPMIEQHSTKLLKMVRQQRHWERRCLDREARTPWQTPPDPKTPAD